jgi:hypothetical protein
VKKRTSASTFYPLDGGVDAIRDLFISVNERRREINHVVACAVIEIAVRYYVHFDRVRFHSDC